MKEVAGFLKETSERLSSLCERLEPYQDATFPLEVFPETKSKRKSSLKDSHVDAEVVATVALELKEIESQCLEGTIDYSDIAAKVRSLMNNNKKHKMNAGQRSAVAKELGIEGKLNGTQAIQAVEKRFERLRQGAIDSRVRQDSFRVTSQK